MTRRAAPPQGAFTLIEVLAVMAIVGLLFAFLLPALGQARKRSARARCWAEVERLGLALASYEADTRLLPRLAPRSGPGLFFDDAPALCAALLHAPAASTGGGPGGPYVTWSIPLGRVVDRSRLEPATMGTDGETGVVALGPADLQRARFADFQAQHGPRAAEPLVLLSPWGNPYHYREWASVPSATREALERDPPARVGFSLPPGSCDDPPVAGPVLDAPRGRYQLWSNGPNGINEFGEGDDVASWRGL
ncbi:MAG: prepilin-type N-terminal cleavage/methylation domain-containing protein [Planctomycetes bacterium]|nr:prepilin-type N-terminal cleavage/methylation domain-containing protein [Planctomycetota bacterium]